MIIDPLEIHPQTAYQLVISSVVPRPIAWISTVDRAGTYNLAPFSFFMGVTGEPPTFAIANNWRRGRGKKDTLTNIEATGEFVINLVTEELQAQMNTTSSDFAAEVDEFKEAGLTSTPSKKVKVPRVLESPVNIECKLEQVIYLGHEDVRTGLIIGTAILWHIRDDLLTSQHTVDVSKLHAVGRLSGSYYTRTRDLFEMLRPDIR